MKPHPRIRKTIKYGKYGGAALTVLLVVVWIGSGWCSWTAECGGSLHPSVMISNGRIFVWYVSESRGLAPDATIGFTHDRLEAAWLQHDSWHHAAGAPFAGSSSGYSFTQEVYSIAAWIPIALTTTLMLTITALAFRLDTLARRRERMNLCTKCHYDRTGLAVEAVCPECGAAPSSPQRGDGL